MLERPNGWIGDAIARRHFKGENVNCARSARYFSQKSEIGTYTMTVGWAQVAGLENQQDGNGELSAANILPFSRNTRGNTSGLDPLLECLTITLSSFSNLHFP